MGKYDVVILGSGLGGLECGVILSKEGLRVCLLEQSHTFGGCLQSFTRGGVLLDTGIHYLGGLGEGQVLNKHFKYFGILDSLNIKRLDAECFDEIHFGDKKYCYAEGYDNFYSTMVNHFPKETAGIKEYINGISLIGDQVNVEKLKNGVSSVSYLETLGISASGFIAQCTNNVELQNVLAGTSLQYAGVKGESTLYHHAMINHTNIEGAYRFVDGTQQVADALVEVIRANGGDVFSNSKVVSINTTNSGVSSVTLSNGEVVEGVKFISNIHPAATFNMVEKTPLIKKAYTSRLNLLANTAGAFSVYLIMKQNSFKYFNKNYYFYRGNDAWKIFTNNELEPEVVLFSTQAQSSSPEYSKVLTIICPIEMSLFERWRDTSCNHRGEDYIELKNMLADKIINFVCERVPNIRGNIEKIITTSPLSYMNYTATKDGSAYGIHKNCNTPLQTLIPVRTKIPNLFLTGQNVNVHGAIGVTMTASLTCMEVLGDSNLIKKISNG